jgi:REP element-mobilizing transposase RayT
MQQPCFFYIKTPEGDSAALPQCLFSYLYGMSVRKEMPFTEGVYFITFTCYKWLPLFEVADAYDAVYQQFDILKLEGHYILGYVIMPNHVHALIAFANTGKSINLRIGTLKRFLAYELVSRIKKVNRTDLMEVLGAGVNNTDGSRGKLHEVFEPSFDCKECIGEKMIIEKLDYIHANPCKGVWQLASSPADYLHSSASYYITNEQGKYSITNYMQLMDIDLTKKV